MFMEAVRKNSRRRATASVIEFPSTLTLTGWWDPSDLSTMFQDTAGTTPVTADGQPVARINDKSGNGRHFTQSGSAERPTYKTSGGLHWLDFDGTDDYLTSGAVTMASFASVSVHDFYIAGRFDAVSTDAALGYQNVCIIAGLDADFIFAAARSSNFLGSGVFSGSDKYANQAFTVANNNFLVTSRHDGSSLYCSVNGSAETSLACGSANATSDVLNVCRNAFATITDGRWYGACFSATALSAPNRTSLITWLGAKAGLTI